MQRTLGEMSKPKTYELRNGTKVEVHTPFTTRAKELMQLYNGLNLPMLTVDERLDVLLHVKWTVKVRTLEHTNIINWLAKLPPRCAVLLHVTSCGLPWCTHLRHTVI
jgi:hypothetical protein